MRQLAMAYLALAALDVWTTHLGLKWGYAETNPVNLVWLALGGEPLMFAVKALATALVLLGFWRVWGLYGRLPQWVLAGLAAVQGLVVLNNAWLLG